MLNTTQLFIIPACHSSHSIQRKEWCSDYEEAISLFLYRCRVRDTWYVQACRSFRRPDKRMKREYVASLGTPQEALSSIQTQLASMGSGKIVLEQAEPATLNQWEARSLQWLNEEKPLHGTQSLAAPVVTTTLSPSSTVLEVPCEAKPVSIDTFSFWLQTPLSERVSLYERHTSYCSFRSIATQNKPQIRRWLQDHDPACIADKIAIIAGQASPSPLRAIRAAMRDD